MKYLLLQSLLLLPGIVFAQSPSLKELVDAERAFAKASQEESTKAAFVTFMHDSGFIFQQEPVKGKAFWSAAPEANDVLSWQPVYASVAASGELGYTSGPWEYRASRADTGAAANGYYVSVWKKEAGTWKVILDIGISFPLKEMSNENFHFQEPKPINAANKRTALKEELLQAEQKFIEAQKQQGNTAYSTYLLSTSRVYRPAEFPYLAEKRKEHFLHETDKHFSFSPIDGAIAQSGDLGYVYGKVDIVITKEGSTRSIKGHYLRIWETDNTGNLKIALDLIAPAQ
jgi:ketosteroid isomerase-like protein